MHFIEREQCLGRGFFIQVWVAIVVACHVNSAHYLIFFPKICLNGIMQFVHPQAVIWLNSNFLTCKSIVANILEYDVLAYTSIERCSSMPLCNAY